MQMRNMKFGRLIIAGWAISVISCGGTDNKTIETNDISKDPAYQKGLALVAKNKCLVCHAIKDTITGPPYSVIAKRYAGLPDTIVTHLAKKVISGGNGVWGQTFMIAHPGVSEQDAESMVRYILLLKD
jgi:cytochrome c